MTRKRITRLAFLGVLLATRAVAQETHAHHGESEMLGTVRFPVSCSEQVRPAFTRAVALLHSFGYEDARDAFAAVAEKDPACGMASWGVAEDRTGKHPVTPGSVLPARELLADMLRETGRPAEALAEYEASLRQAPNRWNGLFGAARSAELAGDSGKARQFYAKLLENSGGRHPDREEIKQARDFLEKTKS